MPMAMMTRMISTISFFRNFMTLPSRVSRLHRSPPGHAGHGPWCTRRCGTSSGRYAWRMSALHTHQTGHPVHVIVMGVSGCGKTHVGRAIADHLGWPFLEGDTLHAASSIAKMRARQPLDDTDRQPWLRAIGDWLDKRQAARESAVVACSALKRRYRDTLRNGHPGVCFVWLQVERAELERRMRQRAAHFMPAALLDSQLATLEPPEADEPVLAVDANGDADTTVQRALDLLESR